MIVKPTLITPAPLAGSKSVSFSGAEKYRLKGKVASPAKNKWLAKALENFGASGAFSWYSFT